MSNHPDTTAPLSDSPLDTSPDATPCVLDDPGVPYPPPTSYDPADYRWVPVRRRARLDGWTEEKQRRFIEVLADTDQVRLAAKTVALR